MNIAITDTRKARVVYDDLREWIVEADKLFPWFVPLVEGSPCWAMPRKGTARIRAIR